MDALLLPILPIMTARVVFLFGMICCSSIAKAQLTDHLRVVIEAGFIGFSDSEKLSFLINLEPKIRSSENSFIGLRLAMAINSQTFENEEGADYRIDDQSDHGFLSLIPTFDYYWGDDDFRPYAGIGVGPYLLGNQFDLRSTALGSSRDEVIEVSPDIKIGALVRGGFEIKRLRIGVEYNFIPKADIQAPDDEVIGTVKSGYFGGTVGYVFGGNTN